MRIDRLSLSLPGMEVSRLLRSIPLPQGVTLLDSSLSDNSLEITVRSSEYLGLPVRLRVEVLTYSGHRVNLKVTPPLKLTLRQIFAPLFDNTSVTTYATHSLVAIDLVSMSQGKISSVNIERITVTRQAISVDVTGLDLDMTWQKLIGK
ncbi:MAG TPA: hypothetical protein GXX30_01390 [Firmicutes bacterium]|uniref:DUF2993 domain-containing protein n=1 Tax=Candidatus Fermentithermobacillus carboniphilus TaxID=3085328 RepID=A0AAT9LCI6_9FIRM|nr:MAG: hypothetical protein IMF26_01620 [Candidatus Fermentithermobacillus carboniphilus]HHW17542.1 hypothetical protein [Candidatus Fermentithermobacillaceae bacterium]